MHTFEKFERISGLSINYDKTEILKIGSIKESKEKILQEYCFKWKPYITVLGLEIYNDLNKTCQENYSKKILKMKNIMNLWSQRETTMYGKILLSKSLILSQYNYLCVSLCYYRFHISFII